MNVRTFRIVLFLLALAGMSRAQVVFTLNGPGAVSYCDRFAVTGTLLNAGETLSHLTITQTLPSASYHYVPGLSQVLLDGAPVYTGAAAEPATNTGTTLVWNLTNLVGTVNTDHLLITEVFYNTGGTTPDLSRQWVELFNPTTNVVSLAGWTLKDALPGQTSALPAVAISPHGFLIVAASTNAFLADNPGYSGALTEVAGGSLGKGLNYFASGISLINPSGQAVDAMSYGASTAAFSPSCPTVAAGHSLARDPADQDTNTRADWIDQATPNPGAGRLPLGVPGGSEVTVIFFLDVPCGTLSGEFVASAAFQQPDGGAMNVATGATFVTMLPGSLTITKTPSLQSAGVGDTVAWTITVRNEGFGRAVNAVVTDTLGPGLAFTGFSMATTNAAPYGHVVAWDASTIPALASLAAGAQVVLTVTGVVNECAGLWNQADARWGCNGTDACQDTAPGMTALAGINFIRRPPALSGGVSPAGTIAIDYCAGSPVTLAITNAAGAGPARAIRYQPLLPADFEAVGAAVSNGWIVVGDLAGGQATNVTFTLHTKDGVCAPPAQAQFGLLAPSYTDACGTPFASPVLSVSFQLTPPPTAVLRASIPGTIRGDVGQGTASLTLVYSNFNNTQVTITDLFPAQTNVVAANLSAGGTLTGGTNLAWSATLTGDGVWTGRFDIVLVSGAPCHVPPGNFANRLFAQGVDCHGCPVPIAGTNTVSYFGFANGASCYTNGTGTVACAFSAAVFGPPLAEVCEPAQLYAVYTNFAGAALPTNWNGVIFQSDLAGGQGWLSSTNAVTVEVNGVDLTGFASVLQTSPVFRLDLSGLSASALPAPTAGGVVTIGWQVSATNVGSVADSSSLALPACGGNARWYWNVGASAMGVVLQPIINYAGCMPAAVRIDLSNLAGPAAGSGAEGLFPAYDVQVVLDLDADGDGNSTYAYIPGSTILTNLIAWGGGSLTNSEPAVNGHTLTWSLGNLATNGAGSLLLQLRSGCSQTPGDEVRAAVVYNDLCHAGGSPRVATASSDPVTVLPLQTGQLTTYLDPELQPLTGSNVVFTIAVHNTGAGPAMNAVSEFDFPTNLAFVSASVAPSSVSASNAVWDFNQLALTVPTGDLADIDSEADAAFDDLPANGTYAITVTMATLSCGDQTVLARSWSGCSGVRCQTSPDASAAFRTIGGALVSSATFPAEAAICTTNTALMRVRNTSIADAYSVVARLAVPQGGIVIPGSYRYVYGGVTSAVTAASGSGTAADPLIFASDGVLPFVTLGPEAEVDILCDVFLPCSVAAGSKTFVTSSRLVDACGLVAELPAVNSTVFVAQPQMTLALAASLDGTNFTTSALLVEPGDTILYRLTFQHTAASRANAPAVQLGAVLPAIVQYLGASLAPDTQAGTNGAHLSWLPGTVARILPAGVSQPQDPPLSIIVTGRVTGCGPTAYATATLDYGCAIDQLCLGANASHPITTQPRFPGPAIVSTLALTPCGGTKTAAYTNLNGAAQDIVIIDTAPAGYVFSGVSVQGDYANASGTITYGGSPTGRTVTLDFTGAPAIPLNHGFSLAYTLRSDGTTLDHLANPLDLNFADPSPPPPSIHSSPMTLVYHDLCGNAFTNIGSASALNEQPDARVDVQPNSMIVTNGQVATFTVTVKNLAYLGDADNLHVRVRLGPAWSNLQLVSSNLVQSGTPGFAVDQNGSTNLLVDLPGVVLNTLYDEVVLTLQATATAAAGDLNILAEVTGGCDDPAIPRGAYTNTLGEAALADTMDSATIHPVNGAYYSFAQDESFVVGFNSGKTVRYAGEPAAAAGAARDARIGESLIFRLSAQFFGNNFGTVLITDSLPGGLVYGTPADAGSGGGITNWTFDAQTGIFHVLPDPLVNGPSTFAVDLPVLVSNVTANAGLAGAQRVITNDEATAFSVYGVSQTPATTSACVRIVEPDLQLTQTVVPNQHLQAGMLVVVTNVIAQAPDALTNAYHLVFTDTLPPGLVFAGMLSGETGVVASGSTIAIAEANNPAFASLAAGGQLTVVFQALVVNQLVGATLTNTAQVVYTSLDAVPPGSQPRTGADGTNGVNSYLRTAATPLVDDPVRQATKYAAASSQTNTAHTATNDTLTIGERIVYAIRVDLPQGLTTNLTITDHVPAGLAWVGSNADPRLAFPGAGYVFEVPSNGPVFAQTPDAGLGIATNAEAGGGTAVAFTIPSVVDAADGATNNDYLVLKLQFAVLDTGVNAGLLPGFRLATNTVEVAAGQCPTLAASAPPYDVAEPQLALVKTMAPAVVDAGDMVTVTVTAANSVLARADAYHVAVLDVLSNTVFDPGSVEALNVPAGWTFVTNGVAGGVSVQFASGFGVPLPAGTNALCQFRARIAQAVSPNFQAVNAASITADTLYDTAPTGLAARAYTASAQAGLAVPNLALAKTLFSTSATNLADSTGSNVQIGETITYRLAVTLPQGTVTNLAVTDPMPAGLAYILGSAAVDASGFNGGVGALAESPAGTPGNLSANGQAMTFTLAGPTVCNGTAGTVSNTFAIVFKALVLNAGGNLGLPGQQTVFANQASVTFPGNPSNAVYSGVVTNTVIEPRLGIAKTMTPTSNVDAGDTLTITLTVTNSGLATAYDMALTDVLNPAWFDVTSAAASNIPNGFLFTNVNGTVSIFSDPNAAQTNRTLMAGRSLTAIFRAKTGVTLNPNATLTNAASVAADTMDGTNTDSSVDQQRAVFAVTTNAATALSRNVAVSKTLAGTELVRAGNNSTNQAVIGELVTYRLTLTVPEGTTPGVVFHDTLAPGLAYVTNVSLVATSNVSVATNPPTVTVSDPGSGQHVQFGFGDIVNANTNNSGTDQVVFAYQAVVLDITNNQAGVALSNSASFAWGTNAFVAVSTAAVVMVVEPTQNVLLAVAPDNAGVPGPFAATLTTGQDASNAVYYRIVATNSATASDTAGFNLQVIDTFTNLDNLTVYSVTNTRTVYTNNVAVSGLIPTSSFAFTGPTLGVAGGWSFALETNSALTIIVRGTLSYGAVPGSISTNIATIRWSSLTNDAAVRSSWNANAHARTGGALLPGPTTNASLNSTVVDNYAASSASITLTENSPNLATWIVASSESHTLDIRPLYAFTNNATFSSFPALDPAGNPNSWTNTGNVTPQPYAIRIAGNATEKGVGHLDFSATPLDLRGYYTLGVFMRALTANAATPLRLRLYDTDGTIWRFDLSASPTSGMLTWTPLAMAANINLLAPSSVDAAGSTPGLNLAAISGIDITGDAGGSVEAIEIASIYALRTLAVPGEIVRIRQIVELPEGTSPDFSIYETGLPAGFKYLNDGSARVAFLANGPGITSYGFGSGGAAVTNLTGATLNLAGSDTNVLAISLAPGSGNGLAIGGTGPYSNSVSASPNSISTNFAVGTGKPYFRLGTLVNNDNDADAEYVILEFNALVANDADTTPGNGSAIQAGTAYGLTFQTYINTSGTPKQIGTTTAANDFVNTIIVEPQIDNLTVQTLVSPVDAGDPVTYRVTFSNTVDQGGAYGPTVRAATANAFAATFLSSGGTGGSGRYLGAPVAIDGLALADNDRVLVKDQAVNTQNGIYKVVDAANGIWDRATDFSAAVQMTLGYRVRVLSGSTNAGRMYALDAVVATVNTTAITFSLVAPNPSVRVATTGIVGAGAFANNTLTGAVTSIDGVTLAAGDRVLVKNQNSTNGIYTVTYSGGGTATLVRATDYDVATEAAAGLMVYVASGLTNGGQVFAQQTIGAITLNTTAITWVPVTQVTAFDIVLSNALPPGVLFSNVTITTPDVPGGITLTSSGPFTGGTATVPAVGATGAVTVTIASLAPAASLGGVNGVTLDIAGTVTNNIAARTELVNSAILRYTSLPGTGTAVNATGSVTPGISGNDLGERDGSGFVAPTDNTPPIYLGAAGQRNNYAVGGSSIDTLGEPSFSKSFRDGAAGPSATGVASSFSNQVAIGEVVFYDILVTLPEGTTTNLVVSDTLPAGLRLDAAMVITNAGTGGAGNQSARLAANFFGSLTPAFPLIAPALPATGPTNVAFTLTNCTAFADNNPNNNAFVLRLRAMVLNTNGNVAGAALTNLATLRYSSPATNSLVVYDSMPSNMPVVVVVEPAVTVAMTGPAGPVDAGDPVVYTFTLTNTSGQVAYDMVLTDALPAQVFGAVVTNTGFIAAGFYQAVVDAATTNALAGASFSPTGGTGKGGFTGAPSALDGVALTNGAQVLVKDQADASQDGLYAVTDAAGGSWSRLPSYDDSFEMIAGYRVNVSGGLTQAGQVFVTTNAVATVNTTPQPWLYYAAYTAPAATNFVIMGGVLRVQPGFFLNMPPGATVTFQVAATVANALHPGDVINDAVTILWTSTPGPNPDERTGTGGGLNTYFASSQTNAVGPSLIGGDKFLFATDRPETAGSAVTIGESVTYALRVTLPEGTITNLTVTDLVPAGMQYTGFSLVTAAAGSGGLLAADFGGGTIAAPGFSGSATNGGAVTFTFGSILNPGDNLTNDNAFLVLVTNRVLNVAGNVGLAPAPSVLTNLAIFAIPGGGAAITSSPVTVNVVEPWLGLTKDIVQTSADAGDTLDVVLVVTNTGTSASYDTIVRDPLPPGLFAGTNALLGTAGVDYPAGFIAAYDAVSNAVVYSNGTVAAGGTATFTFHVPLATGVLPGQVVTNTAQIAQSTTLSSAVPGERYEPGTQAVDTVTIHASSVSGYVYGDSNNNGVKDGGEPAITNVTITLSGTNNLGGQVLLTVVTAADGSYAFNGLRPGTYTLTASQPAGWLSGRRTAGAPFGGLVNNAVDGQTIVGLSIPAGQNNAGVGYNFGELLPGSLAGRVYVDLNTNGVYDIGEPGITNVAITLTGTDDRSNAVNLAATTDTNGQYVCANLRPGAYALTETQPAGYGQGAQHVGSLGGTAGPDTFTGIAMAPGNAGTNYDFGETVARLGHFVWEDLNGNGVQDAGEPGIGNVTVRLLNAASNVVASVTTGGQGQYAFTNLLGGTYLIEFVAPTGMLFTLRNQGTNTLTDSDADGQTGRTAPFVLAPGASDMSRDAGLYRPASIGDFTWVDANANGQQNGGETGLANVVVQLYGTNDTVLAVTTSSVAGAYAFTSLPPGAYSVGFTLPAGWLFTTSNVGSDATDSDADPVTGRTAAYTLTSGQTDNTVDAGFYQVASVAGAVLMDVNGNGVRDGEDTNGIAGATVRLYDAASNLVATAITPATGAYAFTNLVPAAYTLVETDAAGYLSTGDTSGPNDNRIPVVLPSGQNSTGNDFLDALPAAVGDFVWLDTNGNGLQDEGEPGISNVTVRLFDAASNVVHTTSTDAGGFYIVTNVAPGNYTLQFIASNAFAFTLLHAGTNAAIDSDVIPGMGRTPAFTLASGQTDLTRDAGLFQPAAFFGYGFIDLDANLVRNAGDSAAVNVPTALLTTNGVVVGTAVTGPDGYYAFTNLIPATYTVQFVCNTNALIAVPTNGAAATDPQRNRAAISGAYAAATYTILSGYGVVQGLGEPINVGFAAGRDPTAADVLITAYATAQGVVVEFATVDETGMADMILSAWLNGAWTNVATIASYGEGSHDYRVVLANGSLNAGGAYAFKLRDDAGKDWVSPSVTVGAFASRLIHMQPGAVTVEWNSLPDHEYVVYFATSPRGPWTPIQTVDALDYITRATFSRTPLNMTGFFKIELVDGE